MKNNLKSKKFLLLNNKERLMLRDFENQLVKVSLLKILIRNKNNDRKS